MPNKIYDTIIIGAGISGLTAAIYASRKRMNYEIIAREFGGQTMVGGEILNYPGIIKTKGIEFGSLLEKQARFNNINVLLEEVKDVKKEGSDFRVITDKKEYLTKSVVIAAGSGPKKLNVVGEDKLLHKGITYCAICDGPLFRNMDVAIIGGGNTALESVDFLKDIVSKIYVIVKRDKLTGHEYLQEAAQKNPKVTIIFNASVTEIIGGEKVSAIKYKHNGKEEKLDVGAVVIEIGRKPNTEIFRGLVDIDDKCHIVTDINTKTSTPGVFAVGDCASGAGEYQYIIAAGQGAVAILKVAKYLLERKE